MNLQKIIKVYFIFVMSLVSVAALTYTDSIGGVFVSAFQSDDLASESPFANYVLDAFHEGQHNELYVSDKNDPLKIDFRTEYPESNFVFSGGENVHLMTLKIKPKKDSMLESLKFKLSVGDEEIFKKAYFTDKDGEVLAKGKSVGGYLIFDGVRLKIMEGVREEISLFVDLSDELKPGNHFRMDVEKPDDLIFIVDGAEFYLNEFYPIKGRSFSVVEKRPKVYEGPYYDEAGV